MEEFLTYFLVHWGIMVLLYKYNVAERIRAFSNWIRIRFFHSLSECEFCIEHHAAIIPAIFLGWFYGYEWILLFYPFMSASLMNIIKTLRRI